MNRGKGTTSSSVAPEALEGMAQEISTASQQAQRRSDVPPSLRKRSDLPASLQNAREQQEELTEAASQAVASSKGRGGTPPRAPQEQPQRSRANQEQARPLKRNVSRQGLEAAPEDDPESESAQGMLIVGACFSLVTHTALLLQLDPFALRVLLELYGIHSDCIVESAETAQVAVQTAMRQSNFCSEKQQIGINCFEPSPLCFSAPICSSQLQKSKTATATGMLHNSAAPPKELAPSTLGNSHIYL